MAGMIFGVPGPKGLMIDAALIGGAVVVVIFLLGVYAGYRLARR